METSSPEEVSLTCQPSSNAPSIQTNISASPSPLKTGNACSPLQPTMSTSIWRSSCLTTSQKVEDGQLRGVCLSRFAFLSSITCFLLFAHSLHTDSAHPALRTTSGRASRLRLGADVGHSDRVVDPDRRSDEAHEDRAAVRKQQPIAVILYAVESGDVPWPRLQCVR